MHNQVLQSVVTAIPLLNSKDLIKQNSKFCFRHTINPKIKESLSGRRALISKCIKTPEESGSLMGSLSGMVGKQVEELLSREENKGLLDGLEKASVRVEIAKRELAEIERQELEAKMLTDYVDKLENRASEIAECQQEILDARAMIEEAERSLSLTPNGVGDKDAIGENMSNDSIDKDRERFESVKAALVSAVIGTLAELPISLSQFSSFDQLILPLGVTFISCALFGVTFRYTIRRDLGNVQLKTGTSAAFGFVKGLATLSGGPPLEMSTQSLVSHAVDGAVLVSHGLFVFAFASVGLDFCFKTRILSPFPMRSSASEKNTNASV